METFLTSPNLNEVVPICSNFIEIVQGCGSGYFVNRFRFQQSLDSIRAWSLTEPGVYLIYEVADKHDYQNQQLTIYKGTLLVKMIA